MPTELNDIIRARVERHRRIVASHIEAIKNILKGQRYRILSDFNGQPFGRSRPSLKGKKFTVQSAYYDNNSNEVCVHDGEPGRCFIPIDQVEFF